MSLAVQEYLRVHGLEALCERFAIRAKRHEAHPNLVHLKYSQIESPMGETVVQQCRGIVLDESAEWAAVCVPYFKFFNHGEGHAASIDWSTATVYEKLDGTLCCLYFYEDEWHVSTTGTPDASGPVGGDSQTFRDLFWETWGGLSYEFPCCKKATYLFELMTPLNRVVVPHASSRLVLHGVRSRPTLREHDPRWIAHLHDWECVRTFPFGSLAAVVEQANNLSPLESEGYVVCDAQFNRVKVKGSQYVALAHAKDRLTERGMLDLVRVNEGSEFLAYFPELAAEYDRQKARYESLIDRIGLAYTFHRDTPGQKEFALAVKDLPYSGALFSLRAGKAGSVTELLSALPAKRLEELLERSGL